jgi:glutamyl-tRNA synthetase
MSTLGWNDGTEQEIFTVKELLEKFSLDRVQRGGARFDEQHLTWVNGHFIRQMPIDELYGRTKDYWPAEAASYDDTYKKSVLAAVQERLKYFAELPQLTGFFFTDLPVNPQLISDNKQLKKLAAPELKQLLEQGRAAIAESTFTVADLTERLNNLLADTAQKPAVLFSLIRIATTQAPSSPALADTLAVLGRDTSLRRIDATLQAL